MSCDPSCLICRCFSGFGDFALAKRWKPKCNPSCRRQAPVPALQQAAVALRWGFSAEDEIYSDILLEASAGHWCILMSNTLQRLARAFPCCCSALCTYQLYVHQRMGTAYPQAGVLPHCPVPSLWEVSSSQGVKVCVCFPSLSLICWIMPCFSGSGKTGSHLLQLMLEG